MRRLNRKNRDGESEAPQVPATQESTGGVDLMSLGGYQKNEVIEYHEEDTGDREPWAFLRFYSKKANNAIDVIQALGRDIVEGHPYVLRGEEIVSVAATPFVMVGEVFPYWLTIDDGTFAPNRAWLDPQPFGKKVEGDKVRGGYMALLLFLPDDGDSFLGYADVRGTKSPFVRDFLKAVEDTTTPEGAKKLGQIVSAMPPLFRLCATFRMVQKSGKYPYAEARATFRAVTTQQIEAIQGWSKSKEGQAQLEGHSKLLSMKVDEIKELAKDTAVPF